MAKEYIECEAVYPECAYRLVEQVDEYPADTKLQTGVSHLPR